MIHLPSSESESERERERERERETGSNDRLEVKSLLRDTYVFTESFVYTSCDELGEKRAFESSRQRKRKEESKRERERYGGDGCRAA